MRTLATGTIDQAPGPIFRGRPSKFLEVWTPDKQEQILQLFSQGASVDEVAACLGVSKQTVYNWLNAPDKSEFCRVMRIGVQLAKAWWDRQGREGLNRAGFRTRLWETNMRNRYGWMGRGEAEEALPDRARELSEVESVRETVDVTAIIRMAEKEDHLSYRRAPSGPRFLHAHRADSAFPRRR